MARNNTPATPSFEFGTWEAPETSNPYADLAKAFVAAYADNPNVSYTLTIPTDKAVTERNRFGKAVNAEGKTARVREIVESDGNTSITFTLTKRHKGRNTKENREAKASQ